jgi:hypothetical protein
MAFLLGAFLGLVLGVAVVMAFARLENTRAEQRRELVRTCREMKSSQFISCSCRGSALIRPSPIPAAGGCR